ncbi:MFS transporter [Mycobacterium sp. ITM-2016-00318]|uniref:spinster family MFS transporter n=1 Tax=Mycobacterium sp. ITM-2016-00318 TaxID=2099693 RepID=UPI000CF85454|nr:MFS transporter [Mycobacterium sp. ITM-2016-00318]WNG94969.1 MFS transporter [Mycobacterium sp. ITM-2016-00318]
MTAAPAPPESVAQTTHTARRAWAAVLLLAAVGTLNYIDRFLPAVLAEPIRLELSLSDTAIGLINGFGFLAVYAVVGIAIARVADRGVFGLVISSCLTLWGTMTMLGGVVTSGLQLAFTRIGVAIGEAGSTPAAHAYVARNFAPERRAAPLAFITLSIPLSSAASLMAGGLLAEAFGWRTTFVLMGAISVLFAPLVLLILGKRQAMPAVDPDESAQPGGAWDLVKKPSFLALLGAAGCIAVAGYSVSTFGPAFLIRAHGMSLGQVGVQYGIAAGVTGISSLLIIGRLADRLSARDPRWLMWLTIVMIAAILPFSWLAFIVESNVFAVWFIALSCIAGVAYMAPSIAAIQRLAHASQRATASAVFLFVCAMAGSLGPFITGVISDALKPEMGNMSLGRAMLLIVPAMQVLAIVFYFLASRRFLRDIVAS